ncbi:hypothetical protein STK_19725 [Sulfurisphaera tokodaii str. 7]|uniref:Uncharacterized protein n=1 Tax=Sulfurisphaera tokodaii (strain DSM 16993 / JCM 10545 / NBRC 100140 / 7) TaxID=273063 RepID=Q96Z58_SULTO|nr:hypothetical protein STK_19725 [Sulfurisphaera tokodaii str. 7]
MLHYLSYILHVMMQLFFSCSLKILLRQKLCLIKLLAHSYAATLLKTYKSFFPYLLLF